MKIVGKKIKLPPESYVTRPLTYTMGENDTLKSIAKKYYGDSSKWTEIYDKNENVLNDFSQSEWVGKRLVLP
jgi:nucleoid-associated protein YgaU